MNNSYHHQLDLKNVHFSLFLLQQFPSLQQQMFSPNNQSIKSINSSQHESPLILTWSFYNTWSIFCESFFAFMWSFFNTYNIHHVSSFTFSWRFFFNQILETCFHLKHHQHLDIHWILLLLNNIYHHRSNQM